jgi:hypothetical protein
VHILWCVYRESEHMRLPGGQRPLFCGHVFKVFFFVVGDIFAPAFFDMQDRVYCNVMFMEAIQVFSLQRKLWTAAVQVLRLSCKGAGDGW